MMEAYDPMIAPDPAEWTEMDDDERLSIVTDYHERSGDDAPNPTLHAAAHVIVENQLAADEVEVRATLDRLVDGGLDRHDAIHAIGSVLIQKIHHVMQNPDTDRHMGREYLDGLKELTAEGWRRSD